MTTTGPLSSIPNVGMICFLLLLASAGSTFSSDVIKEEKTTTTKTTRAALGFSSSVSRPFSPSGIETDNAAVNNSNDRNGSNNEGVVVSVRFYGESQCPFCRKFVTEVWQQVWLDEGLRTVIDYDFIPWGNAYWPTRACRGSGSGSAYDSKDRACWYKHCIGINNDDNNDDNNHDDCFTGTPIYQHSVKEGIVDIYESCIKEEYGLENAVAFTYCAEGSIMDNDDLDAEHIMRVCSVSLDSVDSDRIQECMETRGHDIEVQNAKQTPDHPGVPYVLVDGQPIDDPFDVKNEICKSLKSKGATDLPDSCSNIIHSTPASDFDTLSGKSGLRVRSQQVIVNINE